MTRRHFVELANKLSSTRPADGETSTISMKMQWNRDMRAVADACRAFNSGFKFDRFVAACGGFFE